MHCLFTIGANVSRLCAVPNKMHLTSNLEKMILENENFKLALNSALHKTDVIGSGDFKQKVKYEALKKSF